jgi:hypothetical protein
MQLVMEHTNQVNLDALRQSHENIMRAGAVALERGKFEDYLALHHPQLVVHVFGPSEIHGDYHGHASLSVLFEKIRAIVGGDNYSLEVHDTFSTSAHGIWLIQFFPDREKSREEHDTMYAVCEFYEGQISQAWFAFWPRKEVFSPFLSEGHAPDGRMLNRLMRETSKG